MQANTLKTNSAVEQPSAAGVPADTTKKEQSLLDLIGKDTTKTAEATTREGFALQNPLFGILSPRVTPHG